VNMKRAAKHTHPCLKSWLALKELQQQYVDCVQQGPKTIKLWGHQNKTYKEKTCTQNKHIQEASVVLFRKDRLASHPSLNLS
jgi:hypothetical protein